MQRLQFQALLILLILIAMSSSVTAMDESSPSLTWDETKIHTDTSNSSPIAEAWFTFSNKTSTPIRILDVKSDCDCLIAQLDRKIYYPGESGLLLARVEVKPDSGGQVKRIAVSYRSDELPIRTTELKVVINLPNE